MDLYFDLFHVLLLLLEYKLPKTGQYFSKGTSLLERLRAKIGVFYKMRRNVYFSVD